MSDEKDEKLENEAETPETEAAKEAKPKKRRRGSAETTTTAKSKTVTAPRDAEGRVSVRAQAKYIRCAPRKARLVVDHIRGKSVGDARAILGATPRAASRDVLKLLDSAVANAENNHELVADDLRITDVRVDEGPTLKRWRARARGRATRIDKKTSHLSVALTPTTDA